MQISASAVVVDTVVIVVVVAVVVDTVVVVVVVVLVGGGIHMPHDTGHTRCAQIGNSEHFPGLSATKSAQEL